MFFTGIDQHRLRSALATFADDGHLVGEAIIPNQPDRLLAYFARFPGDHCAVVEATGRWYWLRPLLQRAGVHLRLAHAKFLQAIAYAKVKTDAIDARTLAHLLRKAAAHQEQIALLRTLPGAAASGKFQVRIEPPAGDYLSQVVGLLRRDTGSAR